MKKPIILCLVATLCFYTMQAQNISIKDILNATKMCRTQQQFSQFIKPFGYCFQQKNIQPTFTYYTHLKCGETEIGTKGIRINFSISNNGNLNSSLTTKNEPLTNTYFEELTQLKYVLIPDEEDGDPTKNRDWYHSEAYPNVNILWEIVDEGTSNKRWHIGFVWE